MEKDSDVDSSSFSNEEAIHVNKYFKNKCEVTRSLKMLAIKRKFEFSTIKSNTIELVVRCKDINCLWKLRATKLNESSEYFWVKYYMDAHSCFPDIKTQERRHVPTKIVAELLKENYGIVSQNMSTEVIGEIARKTFGLDLKKWAVWKVREHIREMVRGSENKSYEQLATYLHRLRKANPETVAHLEVDNKERFNYLFLSLGPSIKGFKFMRKVIVVDGTFLDGKYKGVLLVATAQDGNFQIYPIAFGIVDSEIDASWEWFFTYLRSVVPDDPNLVIISDRHVSIARAIKKVYPSVHRGVCTYHLKNNIILKFRGKELMILVKQAAKAYRLREFNSLFSEICRQNPNLGRYLEEVGFTMWSRVHFLGDRYNITTTNIAESINSSLKEAHGYPIVYFLDHVRDMLTRWFYERQDKAADQNTPLTPMVENFLKRRCDMSRNYQVHPKE